jgi:hypothetical protein
MNMFVNEHLLCCGDTEIQIQKARIQRAFPNYYNTKLLSFFLLPVAFVL